MHIHKGKAAIALLSGQSYHGESNIVCPNCKSDFTHVEHVGTLIGSDDNEATLAYEGTSPTGTTPGRRSAVEVVFSCESCPEHFALVIQQHKGNNLVEVHQNINRRSE
jgi:hypothetical protein